MIKCGKQDHSVVIADMDRLHCDETGVPISKASATSLSALAVHVGDWFFANDTGYDVIVLDASELSSQILAQLKLRVVDECMPFALGWCSDQVMAHLGRMFEVAADLWFSGSVNQMVAFLRDRQLVEELIAQVRGKGAALSEATARFKERTGISLGARLNVTRSTVQV